MNKPYKIPKHLWQYFWDVEVSTLDPSSKSLFVIQRLLDKGNPDAVKWVRKTYTKEQIAQTFMYTRDFKPKIGYFWSLFLSIPQEKVLCLQTPYRNVRKTHWPY